MSIKPGELQLQLSIRTEAGRPELPDFSIHRRVRINIRTNVRPTPLRREEMALPVTEGYLSQAKAARAYGVSARIVARRVWSATKLFKRKSLCGKVPS